MTGTVSIFHPFKQGCRLNNGKRRCTSFSFISWHKICTRKRKIQSMIKDTWSIIMQPSQMHAFTYTCPHKCMLLYLHAPPHPWMHGLTNTCFPNACPNKCMSAQKHFWCSKDGKCDIKIMETSIPHQQMLIHVPPFIAFAR